MTDHPGLPLPGYKPQPQQNIDLVTKGKHIEERVLRYIDELQMTRSTDKRFLNTGRTDIQKGFMSVFRSIMQPQRCRLPEDPPELPQAVRDVE